MANFEATTVSNDPALNDFDGACRILDRYLFDGDVEATIQKDGNDARPYLSIYGYGWPGAWKIRDGVEKDDFEPDYDIDADIGLEQFLKEIAPFLAEPLSIQAIGGEKCRFPLSACEWYVRPGATEIEANGFRNSCPVTPDDGYIEGELPNPDVTGGSDT